MLRYGFFIILLLFSNLVFSQVDTARKDTILIQRPKQDTSKFIKKANEAIEDLETYSKKKNNIWAQVLSTIFREGKTKIDNNKHRDQKESLQQSQGKIIRHIKIKSIDPFGPEIDSAERPPQNFLDKTGNALHMNTRKWVIKSFLLIHEGDSLDVFKLQESERLIRNNNFIYDAASYVIDTFDNDSVDIQFIVQDVWSITAGLGVDPLNRSGDIDFKDFNFLGLGHTFDNRCYLGSQYPMGWSYQTEYALPNIYQSFITTSLQYYTDFENYSEVLDISRPFYSPEAKLAGGITLGFHNMPADVVLEDSTIHFNHIRSTTQDYWLGVAIKPPNQSMEFKQHSNFVIAARYSQDNYYNVSSPKEFPYYAFQNTKSFFGSVGFSYREFKKDYNIFRFGRTEDVPIGFLSALVGGFENGENVNRAYTGARLSVGKYFAGEHYISMIFDMGGYYRTREFEQGVFRVDFLYFSDLLHIKKWNLRNYIQSRYIEGVNMRPDQYININNDNGIRGFNSSVQGTKKWVFNYEANLFSPYKFLGFKFAIIFFADAALISDEQGKLYKSKLYQGYGLGLRFRNEHLVFQTVQILFGFYPGDPVITNSTFNFLFQNRSYYRFNDFQFTKPIPLPYE